MGWLGDIESERLILLDSCELLLRLSVDNVEIVLKLTLTKINEIQYA